MKVSEVFEQSSSTVLLSQQMKSPPNLPKSPSSEGNSCNSPIEQARMKQLMVKTFSFLFDPTKTITDSFEVRNEERGF